MNRWIVPFLAILLAQPALSAPPLESSDRSAEAVADAKHDLALGFPVRGRVSEVLTEPGKAVKKGDLLIRLDDREGEAQIRMYTVRAESTLDIQAAEANWRLAQNEEKRAEEAVRQGGAGAFELERAQIETRRAHLAHELAKQRRDEAALQLEQAQAVHERYLLVAPIDGVVEQVNIAPGEMVDETKPVLRLVDITLLVIEAPATMSAAATLKPGMPAWALFREQSGERIGEAAQAPVQGKIVQVAEVADPGSERRRVRIEVANPLRHPAGSHVRVTFDPPGSQTGTP
ncbi:MAG TPA: efflux RND transporter periplasmic adaptor subunit [Phycisphaerales bacterium]|nr:efflux RND transporter periplasmic adaptor subunit [Phycisphaerales bacterium]